MKIVKNSAFTLVELLVVVTIIVVLLALLLPALEKAVYQAELAKCAAQLKTIATGATAYAAENKRAYFDRPHLRGAQQSVFITLRSADPLHDDRTAFTGYIPLKALIDPLCVPIDIAVETTDADGATPNVAIPYQLWFGFQYAGKRGMLRMGDRMAAQDLLNGGDHDFNVLACDFFNDSDEMGSIVSSHPGRKDILSPLVTQTADLYRTWYGSNAANRKEEIVDRNVAFQDASVTRYADQTWAKIDERMGRVPYLGNGNPKYTAYLPR